MPTPGLFNLFVDTWILDGVRTPMVDYCTTFADVSATDLGIKVAREVLRRTGIAAADVDSVIAGSVAPATSTSSISLGTSASTSESERKCRRCLCSASAQRASSFFPGWGAGRIRSD
jgi:hypothetical protein